MSQLFIVFPAVGTKVRRGKLTRWTITFERGQIDVIFYPIMRNRLSGRPWEASTSRWIRPRKIVCEARQKFQRWALNESSPLSILASQRESRGNNSRAGSICLLRKKCSASGLRNLLKQFQRARAADEGPPQTNVAKSLTCRNGPISFGSPSPPSIVFTSGLPPSLLKNIISSFSAIPPSVCCAVSPATGKQLIFLPRNPIIVPALKRIAGDCFWGL